MTEPPKISYRGPLILFLCILLLGALFIPVWVRLIDWRNDLTDRIFLPPNYPHERRR